MPVAKAQHVRIGTEMALEKGQVMNEIGNQRESSHKYTLTCSRVELGLSLNVIWHSLDIFIIGFIDE